MANLALKNNTGTSTEITMTNKSGSEWKIINNNGTYTLQGASNVLFTMANTGLATFYNSIVLNGTDTNIRKICSEASTAPVINVAAGNFDIDILRIASGATLTQKGNYGYALRYDGTGTNYNNTLSLMADGSDSTTPSPEEQVIGWSINQYGRMGIRMKPDNSYTLSAFGNIIATRGENTDAVGIYARNVNGQVAIRVNTDGLRGLLDVTRNQYMLWYNPATQKQYLSKTYTGNSFYIRNYFEISNDSYWPSMYFKSSNDEEDYMGRIAYGLCGNAVDTVYNINRFYFYQYSYKKDTKERMPNYTDSNGNSIIPGERFRLPKTEEDLEVRTDYDILTTKPSSGTYTINSLRLTNTNDANATKDNEVALIIGDRTGTHLIADGNEIMAKSSGTVAGPLYLNADGGHVHMGTDGLSIGSTVYTEGEFLLYVNGAIRANNANISAYKDSAAATHVYAQNTLGSVGLLVGSTGWRGIYDRTAERYLLYCKPYTDADQTEKVNMYTTVNYFYTKGIRPIDTNEWYLGTNTNVWGAVYSRRYRLYNGTDDQSYGYFSIEQTGTSEKHGITNLHLGNNVNSKSATGAMGQILLYGPGTTGGWILPPNDTTLTSNLNFYMPNTGGTFVTHATRGTAEGSASQPVYIASTGRATKVTAVGIEYGGTGATTAAGARANIVYIGKNPITKLADDTNSKWGALQSGVAYFDTLNRLNGQPTQYGLLLNMTTGGVVSGQLWITTGGVGYLRGSNSDGFSSWYKIWSSKDTLFTDLSSTANANGETLSITVGGVTKTLTLDAAGVNQGGVITTGSQTIAGTKTFNSTPVIRGADPAIFFRPDSTSRQLSAIQNYIGEDDTKITESYLRLLQYSYTTGTKTALTYYETYKLPPVTESRTTNATYEIFTSKNYNTLDDRYLKLTGGTLSGNILVDKTGSTSNTSIAVANDNGKVTLYTSTNRGLYDNTRDKWIIYTLSADNTTRISDSLYPGSKGALNIGSTTYPFKYMYANAFYITEHTSEKGYGNLRIHTQGTTTTVGITQLNLGNSTPSGTAGNAYGRIYFGTEGEYGDYLHPSSSAITENKNFYFPDTGGILVTHATRGAAVGSSSKPVYIASTGRATAITSLSLTGLITAGGGLALNTASYGTDEKEITSPVTGQIYLKYV